MLRGVPETVNESGPVRGVRIPGSFAPVRSPDSPWGASMSSRSLAVVSDFAAAGDQPDDADHHSQYADRLQNAHVDRE